jgi:hypothetical protein
MAGITPQAGFDRGLRSDSCRKDPRVSAEKLARPRGPAEALKRQIPVDHASSFTLSEFHQVKHFNRAINGRKRYEEGGWARTQA